MPTTPEVEARLRRTAAACEQLVDDLAHDDLMGERPRARPGRGRTAWLVAAAVVAAVTAAAGVAVTSTGDGPSDELRAADPNPWSTSPRVTDPDAANPPLATPVTLPDGTHVVLDIPGPERWTAGRAEVEVEVEGATVVVTLDEVGAAATAPVVDQQVGEGAALATWGPSRILMIEVDGWMAAVPLQSDGGDLPDALVDRLARDLTFRVGAAGPVDVGGPGIRVREVARYLSRDEAPTFLGEQGGSWGRVTRLAVRSGPDGAHPVCSGSEVTGRDALCVDGDLLVTAQGAEALAVLPGVAAGEGGEAVGDGVQVPVALPDGTQVVLTIPDVGWSVHSGTAEVVIEGVGDGDPVPVQLVPGTAWGTAALDASTLDPVGDDLHLRTHPDGRRSLLIERGGWTADVPVDVAARPLPDEVLDRLVDSLDLRATAAGPSLLRADGMQVLGATMILTRSGYPSIITGESLTLEVHGEQPCAPGPGRCLGEGRVRVTAGADAQGILDRLTLEASPPR